MLTEAQGPVKHTSTPDPAIDAESKYTALIRDLEGKLQALRQTTHHAGTYASEKTNHKCPARSRKASSGRDLEKRKAFNRLPPESDYSSYYSSNDDLAYSDTEYSAESDEDPTQRIRFFDRDKGPVYLGLRSERPSDPTFDRLMDYRYYRLSKRRATRNADAMIDGQRRSKALQRCLVSESKFSGQDPILLFAFLTRFTEEADLNGLTEAQALVALPRFLEGSASLDFQTAQSSGRTGGVNSWPEAVSFLLTTYATPCVKRSHTSTR